MGNIRARKPLQFHREETRHSREDKEAYVSSRKFSVTVKKGMGVTYLMDMLYDMLPFIFPNPFSVLIYRKGTISYE